MTSIDLVKEWLENHGIAVRQRFRDEEPETIYFDLGSSFTVSGFEGETCVRFLEYCPVSRFVDIQYFDLRDPRSFDGISGFICLEDWLEL